MAAPSGAHMVAELDAQTAAKLATQMAAQSGAPMAAGLGAHIAARLGAMPTTPPTTQLGARPGVLQDSGAVVLVVILAIQAS